MTERTRKRLGKHGARRDVTASEGDRLVELSRACVDFSLPTEVIQKNMLRLRKYCIRLMKRCSDPLIYMFMAISYHDRRKKLHWDEKYLRTDRDDFDSFMTVLLDLTDFPERLSTTYARAIRKLKSLVAARKPLTEAEHGLFFTLLIDMAEKLDRDSDVKKWKRVRETLEKRGRYRFRP